MSSIVIDDTSVATSNSKIVSQICLMEGMQKYFTYEVMTLCGIPQVTLIGAPEDWNRLKEKVDLLCKLNENDRLKLDWWLKHLAPIIEEIVDTGVNRKLDSDKIKFWQNFAKIGGGSGGPYYQGWINVFYPYILNYQKKYEQNYSLDYKKNDYFGGLKDNCISQGISMVPFIWNYYGKEYDMNFYGGFFATKIDEKENTVEPELGWVIERKDK